MEEKVIPVDVEAIMQEIRKNIAARGEDASVLSFSEVMADKACNAGFVASTQYKDETLHHYVVSCNQMHNIAFYQMIPRGGIKSFIKRLIRKMVAPTVMPLRDMQNQFNADAVRAFGQLEAYTLERNDAQEKQDELILELTKKVETLEKRCAELENRQNAKE